QPVRCRRLSLSRLALLRLLDRLVDLQRCAGSQPYATTFLDSRESSLYPAIVRKPGILPAPRRAPKAAPRSRLISCERSAPRERVESYRSPARQELQRSRECPQRSCLGGHRSAHRCSRALSVVLRASVPAAASHRSRQSELTGLDRPWHQLVLALLVGGRKDTCT